MHLFFTKLALIAGLATLLVCCKTENNCRDITGRWTNREGQILSFEPDGNALWLIKFGSQYDTFAIHYHYDCTQKTPTLDLSDFKSGPLVGKTVFGILEWSSDSVFRFDSEAGTRSESRPTVFDNEHIERYFRER